MDGRKAQAWGWGRGTSGWAPLEVETNCERLVHDACQQRECPLQTKRHHAPLELPQVLPKARLPPIRGPHAQLVIAAGQIKVCEEPRPVPSSSASMYAVRCIVRVVLDCRPRDGVKVQVVVANAP